MNQVIVFLWLVIGALMFASAQVAFRLQTCSHGVAVMAADGKSSVSVCQP